MNSAVILFHSTNYAMWTSELLNEEKVDNKLVSVPRQFSSDCGYCVRINSDDKKAVEALLKLHEIEYNRIEEI